MGSHDDVTDDVKLDHYLNYAESERNTFLTALRMCETCRVVMLVGKLYFNAGYINLARTHINPTIFDVKCT